MVKKKNKNPDFFVSKTLQIITKKDIKNIFCGQLNVTKVNQNLTKNAILV